MANKEKLKGTDDSVLRTVPGKLNTIGQWVPDVPDSVVEEGMMVYVEPRDRTSDYGPGAGNLYVACWLPPDGTAQRGLYWCSIVVQRGIYINWTPPA